MEVTREQFIFPSYQDHQPVAAYVYLPSQRPYRGVVQISHGMCEYILRYEPFCQFLAQAGFVVCGADHLGHGQTAPEKSALGLLGEKSGHLFLTENLNLLCDLMRSRFADLPYFLLGHSMGSFVARDFLAKYGYKLQGALISGTSGGNSLAGLGIAVAKALIFLTGGKRPSRLLTAMAFGSYNKRFEKRTRYDWLSRDEAVVDAYVADAYCNFMFTARGYLDLFTVLRRVSQPEWAGCVPKELPVLLFAGEEDPVGDYGQGVKAVYDRLQRAGLQRVELKLYPGGRHEMLNEINRQEVYADVRAFLESCL